MNISSLHTLFVKSGLVDTDSRKIRENSMFFALKGEHFNGNKFAMNALDKGASFAVVDEAEYLVDERFILVDDVLTCLQELASYHRNRMSATVIALTGSNGKTTTKELIHTVLSQKYNTIATKGNLNNHIGVPLTLLQIQEDTEMAIIEMGANHLKEIAQLSDITNPDFGLITNFGKAHLEGFGSFEGIVQGKSELYERLRKFGKTAFVFEQDALMMKQSGEMNRHVYNENDISFVQADPYVTVGLNAIEIKSHLIGSYNYRNIAAAIAIGKYFDVSLDKIDHAISSYIPRNNRSQVVSIGNLNIILDAYNANPSSMEVALENLSGMSASYKSAILGDMFELGSTSDKEHQQITDLAESLQLDNLILIGKAFAAVKTTNASQFVSFEAFSEQCSTLPTKGLILIKGSRGMALERILDLFEG